MKKSDRIKTMYAFVCIDDDDIEGIVSIHHPIMGAMPMVGADLQRIESFRPIAKEIGKSANKKIQLVHFTNRVLIEEIS